MGLWGCGGCIGIGGLQADARQGGLVGVSLPPGVPAHQSMTTRCLPSRGSSPSLHLRASFLEEIRATREIVEGRGAKQDMQRVNGLGATQTGGHSAVCPGRRALVSRTSVQRKGPAAPSPLPASPGITNQVSEGRAGPQSDPIPRHGKVVAGRTSGRTDLLSADKLTSCNHLGMPLPVALPHP